jgi:hypothetical protein
MNWLMSAIVVLGASTAHALISDGSTTRVQAADVIVNPTASIEVETNYIYKPRASKLNPLPEGTVNVRLILTCESLGVGVSEVLLEDEEIGAYAAGHVWNHSVRVEGPFLIKSLGVLNNREECPNNPQLRIEYVEHTFTNTQYLLVSQTIPLEEALSASHRQFDLNIGYGSLSRVEPRDDRSFQQPINEYVTFRFHVNGKN